MKFYDKNTRATLNDEINRLCGVTDAVYSLADKIARMDGALDEYWTLATAGAPKLGLDDNSQSALPVETQNLVAGTNAYQIADFTNKVLQILKITILNDDGEECEMVKESFDEIDNFAELYSTASADRGTPYYWTKMGDFIYIRSCPSYSEASGLRAYVNRELSKYTPVAFTTTHATEIINATAHGLANGDNVILLTNNTLPSGYSEDTVYYVVGKTADTFQVATAGGGSAVAIASDGTGTHKFINLSKEPGIPVIHHKYLARKAALEFMDEKHPKFRKLTGQMMIDERDITEYWRNMDRTNRVIIQPQRVCYK